MPKITKPIKLGKITRKQLAAYMGSRGGKASAAKLTPKELSARGKHAVEAREAKRKERGYAQIRPGKNPGGFS